LNVQSMRTSFYIHSEVRCLFREQGLDSFQVLMNTGMGKIQRMVMGDGSVFYLKRSGADSVFIHLRMILRGRWPCSAALRELGLLQLLRKAGFLAMEPVVWGEQRRFGYPVRGLLVVREVRGQDIAVLFDQADGFQKRILMKAVGRLTARLHIAGFFQPVRLKDIIRTEEGLVLIDRETSKPWRSRVYMHQCISSLATAARRTVRDGHHIGAGSACAFLHGYQRGLAERWKMWPRQLTKKVCNAWRRALY